MLKEQARLFSFLSRFTDHILIIVSIGLAILAEHIYHGKALTIFDGQSFHPYVVPITLLLWQLLFFLYDHDKLYRRTNYLSFLKSTFLISFLGMIVLISLSFLLKEFLFHRTTVIALGIISFILLLSKRWGIKYFLENIRKKGRNTRYILIIGSKKRAQRLVEEFNNHAEYGYVIAGVLDPAPEKTGKTLNGYQIENIEDFREVVMERAIDEVFFAMPPANIPNFNDKIKYLNAVGINFHVMVNLDSFADGITKLHVEPFLDNWYGLPIISFYPTDKQLPLLLIKIYFEFILSVLILVIFSPVFLIVPICIKLDSPGPVLFRQTRIGYHGRKFRLLKFRTMIIDAEEKLQDIHDLNEQSGPVFKMTNDPRITKIGLFLRKYSLDELPQIFNVLKGDMNLVGPRPPLPYEVEQYEPEWRRRLSMKPGITGLWQVSGRNELEDFREWLKLDRKYIENWSLWLDIKIMFKTIPAMLLGSGK